ncbi:uncharacterized protein FSUBG_1793 [Fusarium subglutinans]|uniref:DUF6604 domain-containing protein n=1 Tax=Gibberella subglutinans TaxID=42677 RepID=A0A8H5V680_GIBSU|nr:uncharacterized protein FSUBG_1793 [Fusarium subglutinans]KAF5612061.1 hypothetical protein FSUBG_1793 [Fusarium subglutinans]
MLSPAYMSIYQQYKADTDSVATWLANTAKAHGYDAESSLGGAAADAAKKKKKKVKDFEAMAKHVADTNAVEVPHKTAVALERGIWVRRSFSQKLADSGARRDHRSDATHSHFVEVLEKVRGYLKPIMEAGLFKPEDLDKKTDVKANHPAKGMFDVLNVYTPSEEFLNAPDITPTPAAELETQYTVEEEVTWEDAFFAFATLLRDYDYLSQEIHSLWEKWASGELDLAAVALATNTAFEFAHSMELDIKKWIDKFGGTTIFAHQCFEAACEGMGIDKKRISPGAMCNLEAYDVAKILNLNTMGVFNSYVKHSRDAIMPSYNGAFGFYNERLGSEGRNNTERWNQDKTALFEIFPHMHFLTTPPGQGDVEDELIRGMGAALKTKSESNRFWISWALQMYLDIIQRLGPYVGRGFEQFKQESLKIQNALVNLPQTAERKQVLQVATRWNHDPIFEMRQANMEYGMLAHDSEGPSEFHFLHRNPIHCGLLIHHMRSMLHVNGVKTVAPSGGLMTTTQLYQALRQEGRIPKGKVWEDLEEVWEYQGNPCFFIGNPPQDLEGYFKNYCLCSGVSITNWAANRRSTRPTGHKGNAPNIKFDGWVSLRLDDRIHVDNPRKPWTTETVEEILTEGRKRAMMDGKGHIQENLKQKAKEANLPAVPKSPSGLIEQLAQVVNSEIPRISFDYFTMHHIAWSLLTDLKRALTAEVGPGFLDYIPSEDQLPIVVGYVFSTASGHGSADVRERGVGSDRLLDVATDVVAEFLEMGYGSLLKKMRRMEVGPEDVEDVEVDGSELWGPRKFKKEQMDRDGHLGGRANKADIASLMRLLQMGR